MNRDFVVVEEVSIGGVVAEIVRCTGLVVCSGVSLVAKQQTEIFYYFARIRSESWSWRGCESAKALRGHRRSRTSSRCRLHSLCRALRHRNSLHCCFQKGYLVGWAAPDRCSQLSPVHCNSWNVRRRRFQHGRSFANLPPALREDARSCPAPAVGADESTGSRCPSRDSDC